MDKKLDEYDYNNAFHYKSYRPPLHELILRKVLKNQKFENVLDIGCGIGSSSIALTNFSESVTGYDPSKSMIHKAQKHPKINYTNDLNQLLHSYSLIVFFGSLVYINDIFFNLYQNKLSKGGFMLCCDFQILYEPIFSKLGLSLTKIEYDHYKNLDSYNTRSLELIKREKFETEFSCEKNELIHLLFSESHVKKALIMKYQISNILKNLKEELITHYPEKGIKIKANLFYSYYRNISI